MALVNDGAALLIKEKDIQAQWLPVLKQLIDSVESNGEMSDRLLRWAKPDAAEVIVRSISQSINS